MKKSPKLKVSFLKEKRMNMNDVNSFGIINQQEITNKMSKKFSVRINKNKKSQSGKRNKFFL